MSLAVEKFIKFIKLKLVESWKIKGLGVEELRMIIKVFKIKQKVLWQKKENQ